MGGDNNAIWKDELHGLLAQALRFIPEERPTVEAIVRKLMEFCGEIPVSEALKPLERVFRLIENLQQNSNIPQKQRKNRAFIFGKNNNSQQGVYNININIENDKITLMIPNDYNYNYVKNTANMMTQGNDVEVKEEGTAYRITLDHTDKVIKYGPYNLNEQSN